MAIGMCSAVLFTKAAVVVGFWIMLVPLLKTYEADDMPVCNVF